MLHSHEIQHFTVLLIHLLQNDFLSVSIEIIIFLNTTNLETLFVCAFLELYPRIHIDTIICQNILITFRSR